MANLVTKIQELAVRVGQEFHNLRANQLGTSLLTGLTTTNKTSLVNAINEVQASITGIINDASASATKTWSSNKITAEINAAKTAANSYTDTAITNLVGGAPAALDTLYELAAQLANDQNALSAITVALSDRVAYSPQTKTGLEKEQARTNIGAISNAEAVAIVTSVIGSANIYDTDIDTAFAYPNIGVSVGVTQKDVNENIDLFILAHGTTANITAANYVLAFEGAL